MKYRRYAYTVKKLFSFLLVLSSVPLVKSVFCNRRERKRQREKHAKRRERKKKNIYVCKRDVWDCACVNNEMFDNIERWCVCVYKREVYDGLYV